VTLKKTNRKGEETTRHYDKDYNEICARLRYYFPRWFDVIMPGGIPPYYLRHYRGSIITGEAGLAAAAQTLGHKDSKTTDRFYAHLTLEVRRKIAPELMK
jgi:integrase